MAEQVTLVALSDVYILQDTQDVTHVLIACGCNCGILFVYSLFYQDDSETRPFATVQDHSLAKTEVGKEVPELENIRTSRAGQVAMITSNMWKRIHTWRWQPT